MSELALFSCMSALYSEDCFNAYNHMVRMTGKNNPLIGHIKTYPIFGKESRRRLFPNNDNIKIGNKIYFDCIYGNNKKNRNELKKCDIIFLEGGNTFSISYVLQETGMYEFLKEYSKNGGVIAGESAGSIMCTPTILTAQWADRDMVYDVIRSYDGLNLTNFLIKPHSQAWLKYYDEFKEFGNEYGLPFKCIPDGGAIIVDGDNYYEYGGVETL